MSKFLKHFILGLGLGILFLGVGSLAFLLLSGILTSASPFGVTILLISLSIAVIVAFAVIYAFVTQGI